MTNEANRPERTYITWPGKGCGLAFNEPAKTRTEYVRADLCASGQVRALVEKTQSYVGEYLEPGGYVQKHGDKADQTFNDPHPYQSEGYAYFMRNEARKAILNDLIYMLDGPEQREAFAAPVRAELVTKDNTALAEALHPFARLIEVSGLRNCDKDTPVITQGPDEDRRSITVADFLRAEAALTPAPDAAQTEAVPVTLTYTNWRGETSERTITPKRVWFGATDWHPEPQWLLTAFDEEKQADRDFALKDFGHPAAPAPGIAEALRARCLALVRAYDRENWMQTAEFHGDECNCLRCHVDALRALANGESR